MLFNRSAKTALSRCAYSSISTESNKTGPQIFAIFLSILPLFLAGCSTLHRHHHDGKPADFNSFDASKVPDAIPKPEPLSKYGNPKSYVALGSRYHVLTSSQGFTQTGLASWYGTQFHAVRTSSGEHYDMYKMTAAHKTLPLPTYVRVTNLKTGKSIIVKVNDRGPFVEDRIIDLSFVAAKKLGVTGHGTALVKIEAIDPKHLDAHLKKESKITSAVQPHDPQVYLQLGAFSTEAHAIQLQQQIEKVTSRSTHIVSTTHSGQTLYKVQIGPLSGVAETDALTRSFKQKGFGKAFAVVH
jgi:rare lipoprotein A